MDAALELARKYGAKVEDDEATALARKYGAFGEQKKQENPKPPATFWDAVKEVARPEFPLASVIRGATSLAGSAGDLWGALSHGIADTAARVTGGDRQTFRDLAAPEIPFPTTESLRRAVERKIGPLAQPEGRAGRLIGGAIEGAASSPFGKPMAVMGGLSGLSSEGAGQLTAGTALEPWARVSAGLLAPAGFQAWKQWKDVPGWMLRESTGDVTPQQWAEAQRRMEMGRKYGIDLTAPEAMPPSSIQQLAADVAASKTGGRVFNDFMARRPGQVKSAVEKNLLDPIGAANTPDVNMARAKQAATDVIGGAEKARSAAVRPLYDAARRETIRPQELDAIKQQAAANNPFLDLTSRKAADDFIAEINAVAGNPTAPNNAAALDKVYQAARNRVELPPIGATPEQKTAAAAIKPLNQILDNVLTAGSANIRAGRDEYKRITRDVIDPLTAGPVGRVAGRQGFDPSVPQNLNPVSAVSNEAVARPESIRELYTQLGAQDKRAFPGIARTWLENAFDQATQRVQAGENRMMGANFAKSVYGTDQQIANFSETMRGVAISNGSKDPDGFVRGARNLMEILQMTGKVPGIGSPTGGRIAANEMARSSMVAGAMESVSTAPLSPMSTKIRDWAMQGNYQRLAEVLTSPDAIKKIQELGKYKPTTTTAQALAASIIGANAASQ